MTERSGMVGRRKGWRKPEGAVVVSRPSKWGNPYEGERSGAVTLLRVLLNQLRAGFPVDVTYPSDEEIRAELAGKSLACWCPLPADGEPDMCHATLLLAIANGETDGSD